MGPGPNEFCSIGTLLVPLLKQLAVAKAERHGTFDAPIVILANVDKARSSSHWFPYDPVGVVNADP